MAVTHPSSFKSGEESLCVSTSNQRAVGEIKNPSKKKTPAPPAPNANIEEGANLIYS